MNMSHSTHGSQSKRWLFGLIMLVIVLFVDQLSKYWILDILHLQEGDRVVVLPFLNLTMVWNRAITFGMLLGVFGKAAPMIFASVSMMIAIALFIWMLRSTKWWIVLSLGAIVGGAIGNVIDRFRFGAVVDFIDFHVAGWSWYIFNIADSAIVCGVVVLLADAFFKWGSKAS